MCNIMVVTRNSTAECNFGHAAVAVWTHSPKQDANTTEWSMRGYLYCSILLLLLLLLDASLAVHPVRHRCLICARSNCGFCHYIACMCVCLSYHLLPFASCNFLLFSLVISSFLIHFSVIFLIIGLLYFLAECCRRQLNLGYNWSRFIFKWLYFLCLMIYI